MSKKPIKYNPQPTCGDCGGLHYGSYECPYLASDPGGHIAAHQEQKAFRADSQRLGGKIQCPICRGAGYTKVSCTLPSMKDIKAIAEVAPNAPIAIQRENCRNCQETGWIEQPR